ncbi:MAG TPA: 6-phosphogluconolactonase [Actinomycetota bacterium]|jgi:6-phosphogluconolactonase
MSPGYRIFDGPEDVARAAAGLVAEALRAGARTLVLAGGSVNIRTCQLLAEKPHVEWARVTALFGDERCVPPDHPESNFRQAHEALLGRVWPASVHRMPGELGPEEGAAAYEDVLRRVDGLDLLLLGMGPDGHTASLFPGNPALDAGGLVVGVRDSPKPPPERISLTLEALRSARAVLILATGGDKAEAALRASHGQVPAGMIGPATWMLDRAAASRLSAVQ